MFILIYHTSSGTAQIDAHTARHRKNILQAELDWSTSRASSRAFGQQLDVEDKQSFIRSLTNNEYEFYLRYRQLAPRGLYSLNQNPKVRGMKAKLHQDIC